MFPIGLAYVASAIQRAGHDIQLVDLDAHRRSDGELRALLKGMDFDVAVFGCIVTGYRIVKDLSKTVRDARKDVVIVAGNSVADSIPELLLSRTEVDVAVLGEGDVTIVELMDALENSRRLESVRGICFKKNGRTYCTPRREAIKDIDSIPSPNWGLFDVESYVRRGIGAVPESYPMPRDQIRPFWINTARGCLFNCSFCYHVFKNDRYRFRSPESILREIKALQEEYRINYFAFNDELTFFSKQQAEEFADRLLESGLEFYWNADIRANLFTESDFKLLEKIKQSGCVGFGYSLESANPHILKSMNKRIEVEDFVRQAKALKKAGLASWTSLVLGYPEETPETLKRTFDVCYDLDIYPSSGYLLPQPGTPMYALAKEKGLVSDEEEYLLRIGDRQDFTLNFTEMSDEEFQDEVKKHLKRIADKLGLALAEGKLLKTGHYRSKESGPETDTRAEDREEVGC